MEKLGFDLDGGGGDPTNATNPQEARKLSIQRCIQSLVHACQCRDANCRLPSCHKMKRVVSHTKQCKRKTNGGCPICKQLIALCCYHAKLCQVNIISFHWRSDGQWLLHSADWLGVAILSSDWSLLRVSWLVIGPLSDVITRPRSELVCSRVAGVRHTLYHDQWHKIQYCPLLIWNIF